MIRRNVERKRGREIIGRRMREGRKEGSQAGGKGRRRNLWDMLKEEEKE